MRRTGATLGTTAGLLLIACAPTAAAAAHHTGKLPVKRIEAAVGAKGSVSSKVLSIGIDRDDISGVHLHGVPIKPSFEINGEFDFQPLGKGRALMNGDIPVRGREINPVIDAINAGGLKLQAEHQHLYDFHPMVWFIHVRGKGRPVALARAVHAVITATSTPLPQKPPAHPKTPLDKKRLKRILHGDSVDVGGDGVVTVSVPRRNRVRIRGTHVKPETNISTVVSFEPLNRAGTRAAVIPDFGMTAKEIGPVTRTMRARGWDIGCLYNQETAEHPQLYFSHQFKAGDPYALAAEVRTGLNQTNTP